MSYPKLVLAAFLASSAAASEAAAPDACTGHPSDTRLYVQVEGVRSGDGLIAVTLYADDPRRFLAKRGSLYVGRSPARRGVTHACIFVPHPGHYAVVVYHDANANRKLDRSFIGLPTEGGGFSNNPNTFLGLPSFRAARFQVARSGQQIRVRLRYP
ncbi:MAG: DUF2141 domain-containing protein [Alphaproteobacteria bacterium]|nr:DUF2141 domain-containing protein [Alphaproteobacteria bacterium]MBV9371441.1 DUF2141 domain-containing protein [Alphaproteobacteria bacterium]MBV9902378.1 DUF2141 domain-containing protein [Alphaproteobacteria bacterium]